MNSFSDKRAAILSLGCKVNQYDEMVIARQLMEAGFVMVSFSDDADLYIVNSCTVTHRGDADSRKAARNAHRRNPDAFVAIVGCYSQRAAVEASETQGVDLILGNSEKFRILDFLSEDLIKQTSMKISVSGAGRRESFGSDTVIPLTRSRALLKIQDGCDQFCSYCIVPFVRGEPISLERKVVLTRVGELVSIGYKEIVLTGVHIGLWGREYNENLNHLIKDMDELDGEFRIRISSIEPMELTDELIDTIIQSKRLCRHLHIPFQSFSDRILKIMSRPCSVSGAVKRIDMIKSHDEGWNIGTDLMIGFPEETDDDFNEALRNLENVGIDYFHLFSYSSRPGTKASELKNKFKSGEVKSRLNTLKVIDNKRRISFMESQNNKVLSFIIEQSKALETDTIYGLSDNYLRAIIDRSIDDSGLVLAKIIVDETGRILSAVRV